MRIRYIARGIVTFTMILLVALTSPLYAQQAGKISGVVKDQDGEPLIGATVFVESENKGGITDAQGQFSLVVKAASVNLEVSYLGYAPKNVTVANGQNIEIVLEGEVNIDEVVVIGYGTVRKSDLSGSVSVLNVRDDAEELPFTSIDQVMQGRIAGVNITSNNGAPGADMSVQIRGASTLSSGGAPLYVIDGVVQSSDGVYSAGSATGGTGSMSPLSALNPNDIESIQVLKDASATAIYGSRATNGVIIVTTKQGREGEAVVTYNGRVDVSTISKTIDMLNAEDYALYRNEMARTSGGYHSSGILNPATAAQPYDDDQIETYKTLSTDWQKLMYNAAISQDHQVSVNGGTKAVKYNISGGYTEQNGILVETGLERFSFRTNLNFTLSKRMKLITNFNYSRTENQQTTQSNSSGHPDQVVSRILMTNPTFLPYEQILEENMYDNVLESNNPYINATTIDDFLKQNNMNVNATLNYDLGAGFSWRNTGSYARVDGSRAAYYPVTVALGDLNNGYAFRGDTENLNTNFESLINYDSNFSKKHKLSGVAGVTYEDRRRSEIAFESSDFPNDDLGFEAMQNGNNVPDKNSFSIHTRLTSLLGRVNYTLFDRYIFTATGRYDGSSLLAKGKQWSFFPSAAVAWRVKQESFLRNVDWLSTLKLRASYGETGNQSAAYAASEAIMRYERLYKGDKVVSGLINSTLGNSDLGWERTISYNVGLDFGALGDRVRFTVDAYQRRTQDLLINYALAPSTSFGTVPTNIGQITNRGLEFEASALIINTKDWSWNVSGNISFNRNNVDDLNGIEMFGNSLGVNGKLGQPVNITKEGYPIGSFYGYVIDGLYQNAQEVAAAPSDAVAATPGSFKYLDISGPDGLPDGQITPDDRTIIGNPEPKFNYGVSTDVSYKNFSLSMVFTGREGGVIANMNRFITDAFTSTQMLNISQAAWDGRWTGEGTSNFYPVVDGGDPASLVMNKRFSTFLLEDASFFRLKNVTLSWVHNFEKSKAISAMRLFVTATNLFTITEYSGYDPEVSIYNSAMSPNIDFAAYPSSKTISVGAKLTF